MKQWDKFIAACISLYIYICVYLYHVNLLFLVDQVGKMSASLVQHNPERTAKLELAGCKELLKNI